MAKYRYSARAGQEGGQGKLEIKLYTEQPNTEPVITVQAIVTQLDTKDVVPVLELKFRILNHSAILNYPLMHKEALTLMQSIETKFHAGIHNPTSLIMLVHPTLVNGVAGVI